MSDLVTAVGTLVTGAISWMGSYVSAITATGNEVLLMGVVAVPLVGLGAGMLKRLISTRV